MDSRVTDVKISELLFMLEKYGQLPRRDTVANVAALKELQELRAQSRWVKVEKDFEPDYGSLWMVRCYDPEFPALSYTDLATYSMMGGWCVGHGSNRDTVVTHIREFPKPPEEDK